MSNENVVDYFDRHPSNNECHVTSDERIFHAKGTADGHANGLKDNKVNSHYRSDFEIIKINVEDEAPKDEAPKGEVITKTKIVVENGDASKADTAKATATKATTKKGNAPKAKTPKVEAPKTETPKVDHLELLKNFDPETAEYEDAKELVKLLAIEAPSKSKADLFAAIANHKTIINHEVKQ